MAEIINFNDKNERENMDNNYQIMVHAQYIKDLSFENPLAPRSLALSTAKPSLKLNINIDAQEVIEGQYEVSMQINASADLNDEKIFIIELIYAGVFEIKNFDENDKKNILFIECPAILFPFARSIIANITRDGGLPPLMIDPINFVELYNNQEK